MEQEDWEEEKNFPYTIMGSELTITNQDRDFGVILNNTVKISGLFQNFCSSQKAMLEIMRKGTENRKENIILHLYKNIILTLLEYFYADSVSHVLQLEGVRGKTKGMKHIVPARSDRSRCLSMGEDNRAVIDMYTMADDRGSECKITAHHLFQHKNEGQNWKLVISKDVTFIH